ncbi:hypothetical protein ACFQPF_01150 [Fictibacillus iocasae]|uniref:Uncharacterized protein n=1 Tax=Fictibacillus iocasae TaxID=2715437 RepID=A0ABW2NQF1_9BACL
MDKDHLSWQRKVMTEDVELSPYLKKVMADAASQAANHKTKRKLYQKRVSKRI